MDKDEERAVIKLYLLDLENHIDKLVQSKDDIVKEYFSEVLFDRLDIHKGFTCMYYGGTLCLHISPMFSEGCIVFQSDNGEVCNEVVYTVGASTNDCSMLFKDENDISKTFYTDNVYLTHDLEVDTANYFKAMRVLIENTIEKDSEFIAFNVENWHEQNAIKPVEGTPIKINMVNREKRIKSIAKTIISETTDRAEKGLSSYRHDLGMFAELQVQIGELIQKKTANSISISYPSNTDIIVTINA